ncbi:hypothetical protein BSR03_09510 [Serratia proteamaculans]|nr:hypothetical protein BSR03_09510 [Serratia proteamaculans]
MPAVFNVFNDNWKLLGNDYNNNTKTGSIPYTLYPIAFKLQLGGQLAHPQALTLVSNWGERVQVTTLQLER